VPAEAAPALISPSMAKPPEAARIVSVREIFTMVPPYFQVPVYPAGRGRAQSIEAITRCRRSPTCHPEPTRFGHEEGCPHPRLIEAPSLGRVEKVSWTVSPLCSPRATPLIGISDPDSGT
jgi:hypothetical protein